MDLMPLYWIAFLIGAALYISGRILKKSGLTISSSAIMLFFAVIAFADGYSSIANYYLTLGLFFLIYPYFVKEMDKKKKKKAL